ncbi:hypothetical protein Mzhil_1318 [Methanosalsum zhilinae DSM 4017]|uniref:Uncharacterized protein n=1 Tax=Methanosalsum zhilinae (strain DSM 4017 / NBRC 107636 / OCM 62 / WeN5) TaxID=679901 RepID=F7XN50_METZD|nr:hypothetical protein [Methanosalsum zhilinae]AEH61168.1 hypothetical protein Mzhil_1318 [Methanosalsum zhilinae DSM 4017]
MKDVRIVLIDEADIKYRSLQEKVSESKTKLTIVESIKLTTT